MSTRKARLPTHAELTNFFETFLPPQSNITDVPFLYHSPRHPLYTPTQATTSRVILSITPTPGFYEAVNNHSAPVCFLHRPWTLDRRGIRRGSLVLACHKSFDAHLTVGWNVELGRRLGACLESAVCRQGYKGDPDRKIGLVAKLGKPTSLNSMVTAIRGEFGGIGDVFPTTATGVQSNGEKPEGSMIHVLAIMNAFHAEEIDRVLDAAHSAEWIDDSKDGASVLYLTGEARDYGLEAISKVNMPAVCVGHRACEEWGIRYLAAETRKRWPEVEVIEVLEEEIRLPSKRVRKRTTETGNEDSKIEQNEIVGIA